MSPLPNIETLRKNFPASQCQVKYYPELSYIHIADDIKMLNKKKSKPLKEITTPYHSIGYFFNNQLLRLDHVSGAGGIPTETYISWEDGLVKEAHEFYLGMKFGKKVSNKPQQGASWFYTYESGFVKQIQWIDYEDREYYDHAEMTVTWDYEYDGKGLLYIRQTVMGTGKLWKKPEVSIKFDREKEAFLKACTVTKAPLIGVESKTSDGVIEFSIDKSTCTGNCQKCNKHLSFITKVNLLDKRFKIDNINLSYVPVLFCFDCLESQQYTLDALKIKVSANPFTSIAWKFRRAMDEETLADAFLKIGGSPGWIQSDEHPDCPTCHTTMKFIIEVNTDEALNNGVDTLAIGDSGKLFVFACCTNVATIPQWH